jgi:uncharacterized membrane protein YfcA
LDFAAYLGTGVLSGLLAGLLGLGGGVVVVPALIWLFTQAGYAHDWIPHLAVGTSLATILGTGSASTYAHHGRGAVRWDLFRQLAPWIVAGAWIGSALAGLLDAVWLRRVFAIFLLYVGLQMLSRRPASAPRKSPSGAGMGLAGTVIGTLSAMVGIGGGTLTVPYLTRSALDIRSAVATSSACGLPIAAAGTLGFVVFGWGRDGLPAASTGFVYWPAVAAILLASVPAAPLGARLAHALPMVLLRRVFAVLVLIVSLKLMLG